MDRLRNVLKRRTSYEPLEGGSEREDGSRIEEEEGKEPFFWLEYSIFLLLGIAMLWAWNMFLAAGPYFQSRFASNDKILTSFQSAELSVSTVANLGSVLILSKLQAKANYPKRIIAALALNCIVFTLLALSTRFFTHVTAVGYFVFLIFTVFFASLATGLCQNGVFAYVTGFGREEYTQAIMTGQAIAGVLPCIAQIVAVLSIPPKEAHKDNAPAAEESHTSAFVYFLTATAISGITIFAFFFLVRRHTRRLRIKGMTVSTASVTEDEFLTRQAETRKSVPLTLLFRKLFWLAIAVFLTFAVTMVFPVFTQEIVSVRPEHSAPRWLQPASFIPLAFLFWNSGDLIGRLLTALPFLSMSGRRYGPWMLFIFSIARIVFIPLYLLCNINGRGAKVQSDVFYLVVVQVLFGITNGYVGSSCMMTAGEWVEVEEREAAGAFMGLMLVAGLTVGSLCSFLVAGS